MSFNFTVKEFILGNGTGTPTLQFYKRGFELCTGTSPSWQDIILSGNTALTLTNALANSINYLKLFGATEQRNLPSEYTHVEYLESTDTQYIDTGIVPTKNTKIEIHNIQKVTDTAFGVAGQLYTFKAGSTNYYCFGGGANSGSYTGTSLVNLDATIVMSKDDGLVINGQQAVAFSDVSDFTTDLTFWLFARNNTTTSYKMGAQRTYYFKMWDNGILIQNLIPCRRNSDSVLGMYDTVSGNFLTNAGTGTFIAGADVVPSPTTPMDIVSNNGVIKVSKNLFDKDTINTVLGSIDGNGAFSPATNRARSEYIPVVASQTYTLSIDNSNIQVVPYYYNSSKTFLSYDNGWKTQPFTFTVPNNCSYLCILYKDVSTEALQLSSIKDIQLEKGPTATPYTPYSSTGIYTDGTTETVWVHGKNLFDKDIQPTVGYWQANGTWSTDSNYNSYQYIPVKPNTTYTVSIDENIDYWRISLFNNDTFVERKLQQYSNDYTFTTNATTNKLSFAFKNTYSINTLQLELGSTATDYEPYFNGGTATAEMLLKVGTYQDVQSVLDGEITRNVGIKVLDGTENWISIGTDRYQTEAIGWNVQPGVSNQIYCTHFMYNSYSITGDTCRISDSGFFIVNSSVFAGTTAIKQWSSDQYNAGTPVIIVYPLATPTTETVTGQPLTTQAGTNIVEITQSAIDNLGLEVSYKATV